MKKVLLNGVLAGLKRIQQTMELTTVIEALIFYRSDTTRFHIHSDSKYVINCAKRLWTRKKNIELWEKYDMIANGLNIEWEWVKGHSGNKYNDLADKLAKNESKENF